MTAEPLGPLGTHCDCKGVATVAHVAGEFCLLTEALNFGQKPFLPLKHRIRDAASLEDKLQFASPVTASESAITSKSGGAVALRGDRGKTSLQLLGRQRGWTSDHSEAFQQCLHSNDLMESLDSMGFCRHPQTT